ncbi:hypothetical protein [Cupriavidus pauculus]|uniref:hypothetical protein n=1 Tax=Cupriavidus pauculus TaxID=82633 RepID=UPI001EE1FDC6|nr:hypothetical protein [Cupriavidus pauculus]GJG98737.1 hypothetical protein CBA19C6_29630 [Cupriavidus pauculus]
MYAISNFSTTGHGHATPQPRRQRVLLRPWGFSEQETAGLLTDLPDLCGRLQWGQDTKAMARPDLVIHLVDATRLSGVFGGARWNAMGPVDAMCKAFRRGASEVALVLGSTHHLPHRRHGCWILSGANSLAASLDIVVRTMIEPLFLAPSERTWSIHDLAATHTLCTLSRERALEHDTLARRLTAAVATALNFSHVTPARIAVAAEAQVLDDVVSMNPMMRDRMRLFRRRPSVSDLSAEVIVAYPWPTGLLEDTAFR